VARVLVAAGASGGHVYPGLATANVLRERGHDVAFVGGDRLEATVVPDAGFAFHALPVRRPPSVRIELVTPKGIRALGSIAWATLRAGRLITQLRPDAVLGMGGFASVPTALAAARAKVPLVLHEQNAHLSFAQRIPLRWARVLALGLPIEEAVTHPHVEVVGNPVRASIAQLFEASDDRRAPARERLGLDPSATTVLVLGGSLGSGPLNDAVPRLPLPGGVQVVHLAGNGRDDDVRRAWEASGIPARVFGFLDAMEDAYLAADLAVSRSGAGTVSELAVAGLPSVLVPLTTLQRGDQEANARVLERAGAARVVLQSHERFGDELAAQVTALVGDPEQRARMSAAARTVARPDAAKRLADVVESVVVR
jgi:UDP-N-acetylglucosamine--N-acetylmuramyl-(pentapeptide) pyrophosphoryl-undecaprenol N-acetylglucosamine transferase